MNAAVLRLYITAVFVGFRARGAVLFSERIVTVAIGAIIGARLPSTPGKGGPGAWGHTAQVHGRHPQGALVGWGPVSFR